MKIRQGFVSNSSSSSFVVAFPKKPESVEEVQEMMFGNTERKEYTCYDYRTDTVQIAEQVFRDIKKATIKEMTESINNGYFDGSSDSWELTKNLNFKDNEKEIRKIWDECEVKDKETAKSIVKKFREENKGSFFSVFDYGDDDGEFFSIMEHGEIFYELKHIQTSYH